MNPKTWPTWLKLLIGAVLLAGNGVLPWLARQGTLSPAAHAAITSLAGIWLLLVNTWNATSGAPIATPKPPPLPLFILPLLLLGCGWLKSDTGQVISKAVIDAGCVIGAYESGVNDPAELAKFCETTLDFVTQTIAAKKDGDKRAARRAAAQ